VEVGEGDAFGAVAFAGVDFAAHGQAGVAALFQEGDELVEVGEVICFEFADGEVEVERAGGLLRGRLCGWLGSS
jgi:hypothetical protein